MANTVNVPSGGAQEDGHGAADLSEPWVFITARWRVRMLWPGRVELATEAEER